MSRITFHDLVFAAQSGSAEQRKQAHGAFQAWVRAAPQLPASDRLTYMQRDVLNKLFQQKGFGGGQQTQRRRA
jgi:hypothetical protein